MARPTEPRAHHQQESGRAGGFPGGFRVGRVVGVQIFIDWSLLIIFSLILLNLALGLLPAWHPEWSAGLTWGVATAAALLFFVSVLLHELSHAVVANTQNIPVRRITLFVFGGMAHMEKEPPSAKAEFLMAIVGPITSLAIGFVSTMIGLALAGDVFQRYDDPAQAVQAIGPAATLFLWLGPINILLGLFNMVPGFPLDGGRVLRSVLWWATGSLDRATRWAAGAGRGFAWLLIGTGIFMLFGGIVPALGGGLIQGLWLVIIGWFLNVAAQASYQQQILSSGLSGVTAADLMLTRFEVVSPETRMSELVRDYVLGSDQRAFPVLRGGSLEGLVSLTDIREVPEPAWSDTRVGEAMTPTDRLVVLEPEDSAVDVLQTLSTRGINQIPIVEGDRLVGMVRREDIVRWLSFRSGRPGQAMAQQLRR
jgi:Zn-dependent protease/CBS domain-containing protein